MAETTNTKHDWLGFGDTKIDSGLKKELAMIAAIHVIGYGGIGGVSLYDRSTGQPLHTLRRHRDQKGSVREVTRGRLIQLPEMNDGRPVLARAGQERDGTPRHLPFVLEPAVLNRGRVIRIPFLKDSVFRLPDPKDPPLHEDNNGGFFVRKYVQDPDTLELAALPPSESAYLPVYGDVKEAQIDQFASQLGEVRNALIDEKPDLFWDLSAMGVVLAAQEKATAA